MNGLVAFGGIVFLLVLIWAANDYRRWKALGPGGVPGNPLGWLMITAVRPLKKNPLSFRGFSTRIGESSDRSILTDLPKRVGPRPKIAHHPVPHRQLSQIGSDDMRATLETNFDTKVDQRAQDLVYKLSQYEKHNQAVWLSHPECGNACTGANGEVAHIHKIDGSMHMILSPSDAKAVIDAGWGELHPLAGKFIPVDTYMFIYSPRSVDELGTIDRILDAAIEYAKSDNHADSQT